MIKTLVSTLSYMSLIHYESLVESRIFTYRENNIILIRMRMTKSRSKYSGNI